MCFFLLQWHWINNEVLRWQILRIQCGTRGWLFTFLLNQNIFTTEYICKYLLTITSYRFHIYYFGVLFGDDDFHLWEGNMNSMVELPVGQQDFPRCRLTLIFMLHSTIKTFARHASSIHILTRNGIIREIILIQVWITSEKLLVEYLPCHIFLWITLKLPCSIFDWSIYKQPS